MRHIGELDNLQQAQAFAAFLLVQGIESQVEEVGSVADIWIREEDHFDRAFAELKAFKANPSEARYAASVSEARKIQREKEKRRQHLQKQIVHVREGSLTPKPRLTLILIGICVAVALGTNFGEARRDHPIFKALQFVSVGPPESRALLALDIDSFQLRTASLRRGEIWRLISPIFIHYGVIHILFNMYWLFLLGSMIERRYGTWKFAALLVACGVVSNFVQCVVPFQWGGSAPLLIPGSQQIITVLGGMSGVVYGLFGFVWMQSIYDRNFGSRISDSTVILMMIWLVGCIFAEPLARQGITLFPTNVANWAHGIGLIMGLLIGYTMALRGSK